MLSCIWRSRRLTPGTVRRVAFLNERDRPHHWVMTQWAQIVPPLLTCEAVLAEACFLVQHLQGGSLAPPSSPTSCRQKLLSPEEKEEDWQQVVDKVCTLAE